MIRVLLAAAAIVVLPAAAGGQPISLRAVDGRLLYGDLYGGGPRGVVILAHGGYSNRSSWKPAAERIAAAGFQVLVLESRAAADLSAGKDTPCLGDAKCQSRDVVAGVGYLRRLGAKSVSLIGGSLGGAAVAQAAIEAPAGIDAIVMLAPAAVAEPARIPGRKLFVAAVGDANSAGLRLPGIKAHYARVSPPKEFVQVEGSAHGQVMFDSPQGAAAMSAVLRFLENAKR
jgi:pimeloyl-ACP methyl ester carboxylesterase